MEGADASHASLQTHSGKKNSSCPWKGCMFNKFLRASFTFILPALPFAMMPTLYAQTGAPQFNASDATSVLDAINSRPVPPNAYRVLFIGDSLTLHQPVAGLWDHFMGMAATAPTNDFVHLAVRHIQLKMKKRPVEVFYDNGGRGKIGPMLIYFKNRPELTPDLVVLQGGENDPFDDTFRKNYRELLHIYNPPKTRMIVLGDWNSKEKSQFEEDETKSLGVPFVRLTEIHAESANSGDGGPYHVGGVAGHPNDQGMQAIARAIESNFDRLPSK
jgi:hypothetical protein